MIDGSSIPKVLYGVLQWTFCILVVFFLPQRIKSKKRLLFIILMFFVFLIVQYSFEFLPDYLWIATIIGIYGLMFIYVYILGKVTWVQAIYLTSQAFVFAQFLGALGWQIYYLFGSILSDQFLGILEYGLFIILWITGGYVFYKIYKHYHLKGYKPEISRNNMITIIAIMVIVFFVSNLSFSGIQSALTSEYPHEIFYIRTLVDLCGVVVILVLQEYQILLYAQKEITVLEGTFQKYYIQYQQSKDNIKLANQRYHDIKHQLNLIRAETNEDKKDQYLKDFEEELRNYALQAETGNGVMNTIITSQRSFCDKNQINFTYAIDAKRIDFMNTMDMTSLFGNMFDNAMESVLKVHDSDKRIINLNVYTQHDLLIIHMENYYEHELRYDEGNLATTKQESTNHGYGIKSIKNIVDKYDGSVRIDTKNSWFTITILFSLHDEKSNQNA